MCHIQHQNRLPWHDLEAPGQLHHGQSISHCLGGDGDALAQGFQRGQHARSVDQLVGPAQCRVGHAAVTAISPRPGPLLLVARKIEIPAKQPELGPHGGGMIDHALRWHRVTHDHWPPGTHDARLLETNALAVFAQNGHVVQIDAGDHRAIGVDDVDRVQPPAQADFQNGHVQMGLSHQAQDGQRAELEISQADIASDRLDSRKSFGESFGRCRLAVQAAAFLKMNQMWRGVNTCAVTGLQQHRLQHGAGRALAVGARHGDHRAVKTQRHAVGHGFHAVQPHVNGHRV